MSSKKNINPCRTVLFRVRIITDDERQNKEAAGKTSDMAGDGRTGATVLAGAVREVRIYAISFSAGHLFTLLTRSGNLFPGFQIPGSGTVNLGIQFAPCLHNKIPAGHLAGALAGRQNHQFLHG